MFNFLKPKPTNTPVEPSVVISPQSWREKLKAGLQRTRAQFTHQLATLILGKKQIDEGIFETLENTLIMADVGVKTTHLILEHLTQLVKRKALNDPEALIGALKTQLISLLSPYCQPLVLNSSPFVILMVGVNGAGKTTSIAKIAHYFQEKNNSVMLAAGDTFRAAAVEQLQVWGERNSVPVIAQHTGSDSGSVIFDALQSATAKKTDLLIADTAGRLHTQHNLMEELKKIKRVLKKQNEAAPHEVMLVLDASQGQNVLNQAKQFHEAIGITGITLTKLDGTAKGGIVFAIADQLQLPIRFIGVGETIDDLKPFSAEDYVDALF